MVLWHYWNIHLHKFVGEDQMLFIAVDMDSRRIWQLRVYKGRLRTSSWISSQEILYNTWRDYRREAHIATLDLLTHNISLFIHDILNILCVQFFRISLANSYPMFQKQNENLFYGVNNFKFNQKLFLNFKYTSCPLLQKNLQEMLFLFIILYAIYVHTFSDERDKDWKTHKPNFILIF